MFRFPQLLQANANVLLLAPTYLSIFTSFSNSHITTNHQPTKHFNLTVHQRRTMARAVTFLCPHFGRDMAIPSEVFHSFPQPLKSNAGRVPVIRPRLNTSTFQIRYGLMFLVFDVLKTDILKASLNKP
jgi:hypothetical protein